MPEILTSALQTPGLIWVALITLLAGVTYGFAGFGSALIFMPFAVRFWPVEMAVAVFSLSALSSLVTVVPRAWGEAERPAVLAMIFAAALSASLGLWVLRANDVLIMRWAVLAVATITLAALILGWRMSTRPSLPARGGIGLAAGFVGGATGLLGPVMILFQLASRDGAGRSRANLIIFLTFTSLLLLPLMMAQGMLTLTSVILGVLLLIPYGVGTRIGQALFDPAREALYRRVAYAIIGAAIVMGLPVWGEG